MSLPQRFPICLLCFRLRCAMLPLFQRSQLSIPTLPIVLPESIGHTTFGSPVYQAIQRPLIHLSITMVCTVGAVRVRGYSREHIDAGTGSRWSAVSDAGVSKVLEQS